MMAGSFPWLVSCSGTIGFESLFFNTDFLTWIVTLSTDASCDRCHAWGRQHLLNLEYLAVLSAGLISHNSIHLLIITAEFVALYWFTGHVVFITTSFLAGFESGHQCTLNSETLKPVFWGHNEYKISILETPFETFQQEEYLE